MTQQGQVDFGTGSSRSIGFAVATAPAREAFVEAMNAPADNTNGPAETTGLRAAVAAVLAIGPSVTARFAVANLAAYDPALIAGEAALGPRTVLVNTAGFGDLSRGDLLELTEGSWDRCLTVHTKVMVFLSQAFATRLLACQRSCVFHSIINVTSSNAVAVAVQRAKYCASKAAAAMVSKAFAVRLGAENIAVYNVQTGLIAPEMTASVVAMHRKRAEEGLTLFSRVAQLKDMGAIIAALATGKLAYTTRQVISADAGMPVSRF